MGSVVMDAVRFVSADDEVLHETVMPPREPGDPLRTVVWMGKRFIETQGGPNCFYPPGTFVEVARDAI